MANDTTTQPLQPDQPAPATLAVGAAEAATDTVQGTGLEGGMDVITTPQGKASVDKNAPAASTDGFNAAPALSAVPVLDAAGKRIVGTTGLRADPAKNKGNYVVLHSMVTLTSGQSYVAGQFIAAKDLTDDDLATLTDAGAILKN